MERPNFAENGRFKLPVGYRFHPTDEELVVHYLKRKVLGLPLPASVIPEFDVLENNPSSLPGDLKEKRYFFSQKKLNELGTKWKRTAGASSATSSYWKPIGKGKQIVASDSNQTVGIRKTLAFKEPKHSIKTTNQWVMHEYCLVALATNPTTTQIEVGDWVAYSVFQRKRKPKKHIVSSNSSNVSKTRTVEIVSPRFIMDFTMEQSSDGAGPPSPCSSGVTEVSSDEVDREEISSVISLFSYPCNGKRT
ncbi:hypothetical protein SADUNF_Sadunf17G0060200 [Salix dunnii]|uniref:NAC domain-containing protein n=1 Tax=Salix dunnii TaxID=1413687 RepID=A0A835J4S2_9ROSI|nr:hypothetical protein SADUNF_Sadunf17G0060200 [Salix dunnii]